MQVTFAYRAASAPGIRFAANRSYEDLNPAQTITLLRAWMYFDLSQPKKPKYKQEITEARWAALYEGMTSKVLSDLNAQKTPNALRFFSDLQRQVQRMRSFDLHRQYSAYHAARRPVIDSLDNLIELEPILALSDPVIRVPALEETVTRLFVNPVERSFLD